MSRSLCRYFFKENRLSSKGPLRLDLGGEEEEELSWGDDEDDEEQGEAQAASPPPKPAEEPPARPAVATDSEGERHADGQVFIHERDHRSW